jgi:hypothetical protein
MSKASVGEDVLVGPAGRSLAALRRQECPRLTGWLKRATMVLVSGVREIFDESAYSRFLQRRQMPSSCAAYAAFRQEYEALKARRPRCC